MPVPRVVLILGDAVFLVHRVDLVLHAQDMDVFLGVRREVIIEVRVVDLLAQLGGLRQRGWRTRMKRTTKKSR